MQLVVFRAEGLWKVDSLAGVRVVITGAGRDFGKHLAFAFAQRGAKVAVAARNHVAAQQVCTQLQERGYAAVEAFACDLSQPESIAQFADQLAASGDGVDILINNGAAWLEGTHLDEASDEQIAATITSAVTGTTLMIKHCLPLLKRSTRPDIVTMVSSAGLANFGESNAHPAFYAAKAGQSGLMNILSRRLRPLGIRVMSLYPPDFENTDPMSATVVDRSAGAPLTAQSLVDTVLFAVSQPRDCYLRSLVFEPHHLPQR